MAWFRRRRAERETEVESTTAAGETSTVADGPPPPADAPTPPADEPGPVDDGPGSAALAAPDVAPEEEATSTAEYDDVAAALRIDGRPSETVADVSWSPGAGAVVVGVVHAGSPHDDEGAAAAVKAAVEQGLARAVSEEVLATVPPEATDDYAVVVHVRIAEDAVGDQVNGILANARKQFARGGRIRLIVDAVPRDELGG